MLVPLMPLDQVKVPSHPAAVKVAFSSPHTVSLFVLSTGAAGLSDLPMVRLAEARDVPQAVVHVAVYVSSPTTIVFPVAPFDHVIVPAQPEAVKVALSLSHTVALFAVTCGASGLSEEPTLMLAEAAEVPQAVVQVAV